MSTARSAGRVVATIASLVATASLSVAVGQPQASDDLVFLPTNENAFLPPTGLSPPPEPPAPAEHSFTLRHVYHHGVDRYPELHRKRDVVRDGESRVFLAAADGYPEHDLHRLTAKSRARTMERMADRRPSVVDPIVAQSRRNGFAAVMDASAWIMDQVSSPDVTDKNTVLSMAYMAADAYVDNDGEPNWLDVGLPLNRSADFGWHSDGLRGHVWADDSNSTIVIGLKGTTPAVFDGDGTTTKDKVNDNLFFSCCCAQQGQWTWHQVCDCATGTYTCNNTCVVEALREENRYYAAARELYSNVTELYPAANIWLTGHSLGGAVSSLLGLTYGLPVVTFEAVPEALAASRLGLPVPPGVDPSRPQTRENTGASHFGHTADPIYVGSCNGATASCSFAGYAMETACHTGRECVWDVVADKGWRVGIGTHKIRSVIHDVILQYDEVPECKYVPECRDCGQWKMYESNGTRTTTSSIPSTTMTRTRTSTCETPGWFGCLDESTTGTQTGTQTKTTTTSSSSTSTCKTPGWFWCKDKTTSTSDATTTSTSTCETPGWLGCKDKTSQTETVITTTITTTTTTISTTTSTTTCETPGAIWGCWDDKTSTSTAAVPGTMASVRPPPVTPTATAGRVRETGFAPDEM
ncbi:triacylglycerol lipase [Ophiocordyceps camponoti-floridani]|uniref:triacylglycerol lipase n=1 Tax=Ophiocordyceps camponoti-floridani TaxID=2030778 RepID=A0A8H4VBM4_9HYPO|nr:triacylglycerol lipase [Ophiocordyceps camponoti-floridani]